MRSIALLPTFVAAATAVVSGRVARCSTAGAWLALSLIGQAASLRMISAGPSVHYQHLQALSRWHLPFSLVVLAQAVIVAVGLVLPLSGRRERDEGSLPIRQIAAAWLLTVPFSAALLSNVGGFAREIFLAALIQLVQLANVLLVVRSLPAGTRGRIGRWLDTWLLGSAGPGSDRWFVILSALWVAAASASLCWFVYQRHPHVPDEVAYLFQARTFASGRLWVPPPPVEKAFEVDLLYYGADRWYSPFPPGWPALLAVGVRLGLPWLVNPLLGALATALTFTLMRGIYGGATARLVVLLLCVSPWHLFLSMSFMSHSASLVTALGAAVATLRGRRAENGTGWSAIAGCCVGFLSLVRPLEAVAVFVCLAVCIRRPRKLVALVIGCASIGALQLVYNQQITGDPFLFPLDLWSDKYRGVGTNALGFGPNRGWKWKSLDPLPGHGPLDVLVNAGLNLFQINCELLGWCGGSLWIVAVMLLSRKMRRADAAMIGASIVIAGIHSFYWFSGGPDFGARYWYLMLVPLLALAARGIELLGEAGHRATVAAALIVLCLSSAVTYLPWRASDKYRHYRGMRPDVRELATKYAFGRSLVLVRGNSYQDFPSAFVYEPLDLTADAPIFAWDRTADVRRALLEAYPDRPIRVIDGPSLTGRGFELEDVEP